MWRLTVAPEKAPGKAEYVELSFERGDLVAINGKRMPAHELLAELNRLGGKHGIGRLDLVENRYVGMKSRGCYETPGGTILLRAHRAIESITLDREVGHLKDDLMPRYASLIYNGYWWSPGAAHAAAPDRFHAAGRQRQGRPEAVQGQRHRHRPQVPRIRCSIPGIVTFDDDGGAYNQADAGGLHQAERPADADRGQAGGSPSRRPENPVTARKRAGCPQTSLITNAAGDPDALI